MKIHYTLIVILLISGVVMGLMTFLNDLGDNYDTNVDLTGLEGTQARLEEQQENAQDLSDEITGFKLESVGDFFDIPYVMVKVGWKAARNMFGSWVTIGIMSEEVGEGLNENGIPMPGWFIPTLICCLIIVLLAIIIYAFFKWKWSDQ